MNRGSLRIGVVAPSAVIPQFELQLGAGRLRELGHEVKIHPQTERVWRFYAGRDEERAGALLEMALDPSIDAIWCARGGSGSVRVIETLEAMLKKKKLRRPPARKLLLGYSDQTAMMEFVRTKWGWSTIHAPMPGTREFSLLPGEDWSRLARLIGEAGARAHVVEGTELERFALEWIGPSRLRADLTAELVGGNLTVWDTLVGTPWQGNVRGRILFFEDVGEAWYRVDRMLSHLRHTRALSGARAIVLGSFSDCDDKVYRVLTRKPDPSLRGEALQKVLRDPEAAGIPMKPLRDTHASEALLRELFAEVSERTGIPVAMGVPCGHGPRYAPLPLGAKWKLTKKGILSLLNWKPGLPRASTNSERPKRG